MSVAPKNIVWIASYPKSGNTWLRFLLCNLLYGRQDSASALNELAPDVHELGEYIAKSHGGGLVKTHFLCSPSLPLLERTAAAIYIVRDPADVLASNFYYAQRSAGGAGGSQAEFDGYVESFVANRGDARWILLGMGSWEENVRSWLSSAQPFPVLYVRYEDLMADPHRICTQLADFLRPGMAAASIREAVANSTFERMREVEESDIRSKRVGIFYKPYLQSSIDTGLRFMRRGAVGDGDARLSDAQRLRLRSAFAPLLRQLGYALE